MSEAPLNAPRPLERWTKEAGEALRAKGWKNVIEIQTFWSNREMHMPTEIEHIIDEMRLSANPKEFKEFEYYSKGKDTVARVYSPAYQQRIADVLLERYPGKKAKIEKARLKIPALDESK